MEPLRLEWQLATPWSPPKRGLHLDGLVAHAVVTESMASALPGTTAVYADFFNDLPIEKYEGVNGWCWKASMVKSVGVQGTSLRYLTAKTPVNALSLAIVDGSVSAKGGAGIDTVRGSFKEGAVTYPLEMATGLVAWCIGERDALADLLGPISSIGAKTVRGHGALLPYDDGSFVKIIADDAALANWKYRNLPDQLLPEDQCVPSLCALSTPYWQNTTMGYIPIAARA